MVEFRARLACECAPIAAALYLNTQNINGSARLVAVPSFVSCVYILGADPARIFLRRTFLSNDLFSLSLSGEFLNLPILQLVRFFFDGNVTGDKCIVGWSKKRFDSLKTSLLSSRIYQFDYCDFT